MTLVSCMSLDDEPGPTISALSKPVLSEESSSSFPQPGMFLEFLRDIDDHTQNNLMAKDSPSYGGDPPPNSFASIDYTLGPPDPELSL